MGLIYKVTCKVSGLSYIGQTTNTLTQRWEKHIRAAVNSDSNASRKLYDAIRAHGANSFILEVLHECPEVDLNHWEMHFIAEHGTFTNGYNLTTGGKKGFQVAEETKRLHTEVQTGVPHAGRHPRKNGDIETLPKYVQLYKVKNSEGYRIGDHPALKAQGCRAGIAFMDSSKTMEERLAQALAALNELDAGTYVVKRKVEPKGVSKAANGYKVSIKGYPEKTFQKKSLTMDEKLELATAYAESIHNRRKLNDSTIVGVAAAEVVPLKVESGPAEMQPQE